MDDLPVVHDVRIELPSGDAHEYAADADSGEIRLRRTVRVTTSYPADWAILPGSLTQRGEPLSVLVVTDVPCSPGALARVRLLGHVTVGDERILLAVLADDAAVAEVTTWRQLPVETRARIESLLRSGEPDPHDGLHWSGPAEAARVVRDARVAARIANAEFHATRTRREAWRAVTGRAVEADRIYTPEELQLGQLPARFQGYLARLVMPDERILAFVPRPADRRRRALRFGPRERREGGLLVVTDQQVLWMEDVGTAPLDVIGYGFIARSVPLERLTEASLSPDGSSLRLRVESRSPGGRVSSLGIAFPSASVGLLREVAGRLDGYLAARTPTALMRIARLEEDKTPLSELVDSGDDATAAAVPAWERRLPVLLAPSERVAAKAVIAGWGSPDRVPRLWLVTDRRVLELRGDAGDTPPGSWLAGDICAVRVTYSVFVSSFAFEWSSRDGVVTERFVFPLVSAQPFIRLFVAVRRVMVGPFGFLASDGPQTSVSSVAAGGLAEGDARS